MIDIEGSHYSKAIVQANYQYSIFAAQLSIYQNSAKISKQIDVRNYDDVIQVNRRNQTNACPPTTQLYIARYVDSHHPLLLSEQLQKSLYIITLPHIRTLQSNVQQQQHVPSCNVLM